MRARPALLFALAVAPLALPLVAHATGIPFFGPIVGRPESRQLTCALGWGGLMQVVNNLIAFSITIGIVFIAPLLIAYAGFLYVVNPVSPSSRSNANAILLNTIVGIVIALAAWLIVNAMLTALTVKDGAKGGVAEWTKAMFSTTPDHCLDIQLYKLNQAASQSLDPSIYAGGETGVLTSAQACAGYGGIYDDGEGTPSSGSDDVRCNDGSIQSTKVVAGTALTPDQVCVDNKGVLDSSESSGTLGANKVECEDGTIKDLAPVKVTSTGPAVRAGGRGTAQCADDNPNCSQQVLLDQGLTAAQAAAMSCIAYSENGGKAIGRSKSVTPCGTFQLNLGNRQAYSASGCAVEDSCSSGKCNLGTAVNTFKAGGYQPWTGEKDGKPWNPAARDCVTKYDPSATKKGF